MTSMGSPRFFKPSEHLASTWTLFKSCHSRASAHSWQDLHNQRTVEAQGRSSHTNRSSGWYGLPHTRRKEESPNQPKRLVTNDGDQEKSAAGLSQTRDFSFFHSIINHHGDYGIKPKDPVNAPGRHLPHDCLRRHTPSRHNQAFNITPRKSP